MLFADGSLYNFLFDGFVVVTSVFAGMVAAISGFGIGSLLTPVISMQTGTKIAIAMVAIPHFIGTFIRFCILRKNIDTKIFIQFGISSIVGGLTGALLFWKTQTPILTLLFGSILIFAGVMEITGFLRSLKFNKTIALLGGLLSGFLGGLVGNQGGIRSAALLSFDIDSKAFVATATAVGVVVDTIRLPVYFAAETQNIFHYSHYVWLSVVGVIFGTWLGIKVLDSIPKELFRRTVAILVIMLGAWMLFKS